jgi:hypothetical protein
MKSRRLWIADSPQEQRMRLVERLARWRVSLGFLFGAVVLWLAQPTTVTLAAGAPIAIAGEALRVWAAGHLSKSREVTSSGPYRWFAHPLYVGSSVMGIGLAVASGSAAVAVLIAAYLTTTLTAAIRSEEAFLRHAFGDQYDRYRRGRESDDIVRGRDRRRFSAAQAFRNREYRAVLGMAVAMLLLILKATYNGSFWRAAAGR